MAAFDELVRVFQGPIYNLAYRMVNDREDAKDLTQEVFVKMYRSIGKFRGDSKFSTWLYAIAANTCRSGLRRTGRIARFETVRLDDTGPDGEQSGGIDPVDGTDSPGERLERDEVRQQVGEAVAALPEDFRAIIIMRDMQGLSYEDVAEALQCSMGTVKSRLFRAREKLKEILSKRGLV
jgi:RNA polymerase sigma-70 factor (ECF subfamily)